jgi:ABC-type sugar transport system substrate-binding protein
MARHDSPKKPTAHRALAVLATAGMALGAGTATAAADTDSVLGMVNTRPTSLGKIDPQSGLQATTGTLGYVTGPVAGLKLDPLAGTGVDPLDNGIGTDLADFKPMTSQAPAGPVAQAQSIGSIPVVGQVTGHLNH